MVLFGSRLTLGSAVGLLVVALTSPCCEAADLDTRDSEVLAHFAVPVTTFESLTPDYQTLILDAIDIAYYLPMGELRSFLNTPGLQGDPRIDRIKVTIDDWFAESVAHPADHALYLRLRAQRALLSEKLRSPSDETLKRYFEGVRQYLQSRLGKISRVVFAGIKAEISFLQLALDLAYSQSFEDTIRWLSEARRLPIRP